jgi:multidrug efflux pump subunit AcrB
LGASVPLKRIVGVEAVWEPGVIRRRDRLRTVAVEAAPTSGITAADINAQLQPWLERQIETWESGYRWRVRGFNGSEQCDLCEATCGGPRNARIKFLILSSLLALPS